jgi:hypothetical protein
MDEHAVSKNLLEIKAQREWDVIAFAESIVHTQAEKTVGEEWPNMDTNSRGWNITRDAREGGQTTCSHGRRQTTKKSNVTARKYQNCHRDENLTSRGKGITSTKDDARGSAGAPTRKDITTGFQD